MNLWSRFAKGDCFPNCGCEPLLDAVVMQPFAFWSSLAYALTAVLLYKKIPQKTFELKLWVGLLSYLCFSSLFAHASYTKLALAMDFSSIVVILSFFSSMSLFGLLKLSRPMVIFWLALYTLLLVGCFYFLSGWPRISLCVLIFFFALGDLVRDMKGDLLAAPAKPLWTCLGILSLSFCAFVADTLYILCDKDGWIHGHTLWHFGTGVSTYFYGVWRFQLPRNANR